MKKFSQEEIFAEFNFADEQLSVKKIALFDPISRPFWLFFLRQKKKSNFVEFNFADRAKIREIKFCENFS